MKNKILKTSAVLALSTLLLVPSNKNVYAASTNTEANQATTTAEDEFRATLEKASTKIVEYNSVKLGYEYKNADQDPQVKFNNALLGLEKAYEESKGKEYSDDKTYNLYTNLINTYLRAVEEAKANLNGREVDKTELINLTTEQSQFRASDAYKNASKELKDKYDNAVENAWKTVGDNGLNLTNLQNELAINAVKEAKNEIVAKDERKKAIDKLKEEISQINTIRSEKDLYTDKSYNTYNNAAILAKSTIENPNSTLDEIKSATDLVATARKNLAKKQTAADISRKDQIKRLEEAIKANERTKAAANLLKELTPNIASKNMAKLDNLIKQSEDLIARSTKVLNQLKGIRG